MNKLGDGEELFGYCPYLEGFAVLINERGV
jgi:hypothetical protein